MLIYSQNLKLQIESKIEIWLLKANSIEKYLNQDRDESFFLEFHKRFSEFVNCFLNLCSARVVFHPGLASKYHYFIPWKKKKKKRDWNNKHVSQFVILISFLEQKLQQKNSGAVVWPIEACNFFWVFRPFYAKKK